MGHMGPWDHVGLLNPDVPGIIRDTWDTLIKVFLGHVGLKGPPSVALGITFQGHLGLVGFMGLLLMDIWDTWDFKQGTFRYLVGHLGLTSGRPGTKGNTWN